MKIETILVYTADNGAKGELGIDKFGGLYWNKKLVITKSKLVLNGWVNFFVIVASISTFVMMVYAVLSYYRK